MGKGSRDAERLLGLFEVMSEELSNAVYKSPAQKFAAERLAARMRKRAKLGADGLATKALEDFESTNRVVGGVCIGLDRFVEHNARIFVHQIFERYNSAFDPDLIQIPYDHRHLDRYWRFGPGASNGIRGTHTAEKIKQAMTCTAPARALVQKLRVNNVYLSAYDIGTKTDGTTLIEGSRLTTVPKNEDTERTIAIEPSGNMTLQLAVGEYITDVLRSIGLDIRYQQPLNKLLACRGSIDDSLATIDMKSASDMFSPELVRRLVPHGLYDTMMRLRSPVTNLPSGKQVKLNMISTMGNGFTFPLMTLIFVALVYAVRLKMGGRANWLDWRNTGIFGDDIIVPSGESELLINQLEACGFIVNRDKSYLSGPFRESCGGDYYEGRDVTPVYIKSLASNSHVYAALNGVFDWCARMEVILPRTIEYIVKSLHGEVFFVPEWCGDSQGFRTTQVGRRYKFLMPAMSQVRTKCPHFDMMLACGGYTNSRGPDIVYTPRPFKTRYVVRRARLPNGFLDGRDPLSRTDHVSTYVNSYAFLVRLLGN